MRVGISIFCLRGVVSAPPARPLGGPKRPLGGPKRPLRGRFQHALMAPAYYDNEAPGLVHRKRGPDWTPLSGPGLASVRGPGLSLRKRAPRQAGRGLNADPD
jgi:hypothetical protein